MHLESHTFKAQKVLKETRVILLLSLDTNDSCSISQSPQPVACFQGSVCTSASKCIPLEEGPKGPKKSETPKTLSLATSSLRSTSRSCITQGYSTALHDGLSLQDPFSPESHIHFESNTFRVAYIFSQIYLHSHTFLVKYISSQIHF